MKILFEKDTYISDNTIRGVEFDVRGETVWIQIKDNYVQVNKEELSKVLRLL